MTLALTLLVRRRQLASDVDASSHSGVDRLDTHISPVAVDASADVDACHVGVDLVVGRWRSFPPSSASHAGSP